MELNPEDILVPTRLRELNPNHVSKLIESIRQSKWISPITVFKKYTTDGDEVYQLIAGNHRLEAAKQLSIQIPVTVIDDDSKAQLLEVIENYSRLELTASEKIQHQKILNEVYKMNTNATYQGLVDETKTRTGVSASIARRNISHAHKISDAVLEEIKGSKLDSHAFISTLSGMHDDSARLKRIEREKERLSKIGERTLIDDSGTAQAIATIMRSGLTDQELQHCRGLLQLTSKKSLDVALEAVIKL